MAKTKIVVIRLKEIIYTAIFVGLGILLILLLIFMFWPKKSDRASVDSDKMYKAGKYTSECELNGTIFNLEVVVDEDHINSVKIVNIDDAVTTLYPLIEPSLEDISEQLSKGIGLDEINLSSDSVLTQKYLIDQIKLTLDKANAEK